MKSWFHNSTTPIKYFDFLNVEFSEKKEEKEKSDLMKALVWFKLLECCIFLILLVTSLIELIIVSNQFRILLIPEEYLKNPDLFEEVLHKKKVL